MMDACHAGTAPTSAEWRLRGERQITSSCAQAEHQDQGAQGEGAQGGCCARSECAQPAPAPSAPEGGAPPHHAACMHEIPMVMHAHA